MPLYRVLHEYPEALVAAGAPEGRTPGLWQSYGQYCGDAGIGNYACYLLRLTGDGSYREFTQRIAQQLILNATQSQVGHAWQQAEHSSRPDFVETQTGSMQVAVGIRSFLLHLATVVYETTSRITLPVIHHFEQRKSVLA